jgi:DNA-binding response OmpR family regulator
VPPTGVPLVDVRLPGMDGLALQRYLFSRGAEPAILMITGHGDIALAVAALKAGAMDFVTKPFNPAELLDSVREAWRCSACKAARGRGGGKRGSLSDADASRDINSYASRRRAIKQAYRGRVGNKRSHCRAPPCQHHGKASSAHSLTIDPERARKERLKTKAPCEISLLWKGIRPDTYSTPSIRRSVRRST